MSFKGFWKTALAKGMNEVIMLEKISYLKN